MYRCYKRRQLHLMRTRDGMRIVAVQGINHPA